MSRWEAAWREASAGDIGTPAGGSVRTVNSVTPPQAATVEIEMCGRRITVRLEHREGEITAIFPSEGTDPTRAKAVAIVNDWLAHLDSLESQALRLLALTDLVAGLISLKGGGVSSSTKSSYSSPDAVGSDPARREG